MMSTLHETTVPAKLAEHGTLTRANPLRSMPTSSRTRTRKRVRRGVAVLSFAVALLVIGTLALWMLELTSTGNLSFMGHLNSTAAFYAAESGLEMSLKEMCDGNDTDSDGLSGTISNNGHDSDDPSVATGSFHVSKTSGVLTYTATGTWQGYVRVIQMDVQ